MKTEANSPVNPKIKSSGKCEINGIEYTDIISYGGLTIRQLEKILNIGLTIPAEIKAIADEALNTK